MCTISLLLFSNLAPAVQTAAVHAGGYTLAKFGGWLVLGGLTGCISAIRQRPERAHWDVPWYGKLVHARVKDCFMGCSIVSWQMC